MILFIYLLILKIFIRVGPGSYCNNSNLQHQIFHLPLPFLQQAPGIPAIRKIDRKNAKFEFFQKKYIKQAFQVHATLNLKCASKKYCPFIYSKYDMKIRKDILGKLY